MRSCWFKYFMLISLLLIYINRGLFVAMPGIELHDIHTTQANEVNSLLEIIIEWAGGHNHIDEDGDLPESYNYAKTVQPLIDQNPIYTMELEYPVVPVHKMYFPMDESMPLVYTYCTIDHPPEKA